MILSEDENDPAGGVVHASSPIAQAPEGCGVEDEAELETVGGSRTVVVIGVFDPMQMAAERPPEYRYFRVKLTTIYRTARGWGGRGPWLVATGHGPAAL